MSDTNSYGTAMDNEDDAIVRYIVENSPMEQVCNGSPDSVFMPSSLSDDRPVLDCLIMGHVQSGKTRLIQAIATYLALHHGHNIVLIVRNYTCDANQFLNTYTRLLDDAIRHVHGYDTTVVRNDVIRILTGREILEEDVLRSGLGSLTVCLANYTQIRRLNDLLKRISEDMPPMTLMIDEVDDLMYTRGERLGIELEKLRGIAHNTIGISATVFDPLHDNSLIGSHVVMMTPPTDYKGIDSIISHAIEPLAENGDDPSLWRLLDQQRRTELMWDGTPYPMMMLIKNERIIARQDALMGRIIQRYGRGGYTVITFNGRDCTVYAPGLVVPDGRPQPRQIPQQGRDVTVFRGADIQTILQLLKDSGGARRFPRILIIAHDMINRGINIVSTDFGWHLTRMYFRPSRTATLPQILQSIRLCGRYRDSLPLYLHAEESVIMDMNKGHRLQCELVGRIMEKGRNDPLVKAVDILRGEAVHPLKIPMCNPFLRRGKRDFAPHKDAENDNGWTVEEFFRPMALARSRPPPPPIGDIPRMDPRELHRLTNPTNGMFKKWADPSNRTAIARFMREGLDPNRRYTRKEMTELCKEYHVSLSHLTNRRIGSQVHGHILVIMDGSYFLHTSLHESFCQHF